MGQKNTNSETNPINYFKNYVNEDQSWWMTAMGGWVKESRDKEGVSRTLTVDYIPKIGSTAGNLESAMKSFCRQQGGSFHGEWCIRPEGSQMQRLFSLNVTSHLTAPTDYEVRTGQIKKSPVWIKAVMIVPDDGVTQTDAWVALSEKLLMQGDDDAAARADLAYREKVYAIAVRLILDRHQEEEYMLRTKGAFVCKFTDHYPVTCGYVDDNSYGNRKIKVLLNRLEVKKGRFDWVDNPDHVWDFARNWYVREFQK